jgi:hypothetical protein
LKIEKCRWGSFTQQFFFEGPRFDWSICSIRSEIQRLSNKELRKL